MFSRAASFFRTSLKKHPILTNTAVYATFYSAAEFSGQSFNKYYSEAKTEYDPAAAARVITVGSCMYAPILYQWYKYLDAKHTGNSIKVVAIKVCKDQFIITPVLLACFFIILGTLERREDIFEELKKKYWTAFTLNQMFWIPGQTINFLLVPPHLRVVYVAALSFIWINILCFIKRQKKE